MSVRDFRPAWWLPGPHAVTLWGKFGRREPALPVRWERVDTPDGDFLELAHLDAIPADQATAGVEVSSLEDSTPRLLILHGLEGGVNSHYVRGLMREAHRRGWNATIMLFRTCGPTPNALPRSYHSGETGDPLFVVERLIAQQPHAPLGVV
ncbi:MAG: hydrolase, partial [Phycisphaerae bacterium]|nr:hydrolase [Gemmatimonadaceae bacterium]